MSEVVVNIWLTKGVHHYIYCFNSEDAIVFGEHDYLGTYTDPTLGGKVAIMCADLYNNDQTDYSYVSNFMKPIPSADNVKLNFRPLDCSYTDSFFILKERYGNAATFDSNCVNFEEGDSKPQIRISNTYTYFNITNFAYFENIAFTGEDLFAKLYQHNAIEAFEHKSTFNLEQGPLAFIPKTKCVV